MRTKKLNTKNQSGITLVALVVTIIILIILATISLNAVLGEDGLINKAKLAKLEYRGATVEQEVFTWKAEKEFAKYVGEMATQPRDEFIEEQRTRGLLTNDEADEATTTGQVQIGSRLIDYGEDTPQTPTTVKEAKEQKYEFEETTPLTDDQGNPVVVPGKFKIPDESGTTVEEGIVIEDSKGNQFVWIPVSNTNGDNNKTGEETNLIKKNDGEEVEITLGRYTFDASDGKPTLVQRGSEYANQTELTDGYGYTYKEVPTAREASTENSESAANATFQHLKEFVESVERNHGYYLGRYEASYGSGSSFGVGGTNNYKPLVKQSTAYGASSMKYNAGTLWNFITQGNASKVCRNMYNVNDAESSYVESDLINSYMWDTAIVYIQAMTGENYANANRGSNTSLLNTGETGDQKCKIYDMAGNIMEWTTEYSTDAYSSGATPCVDRGGNYYSSYNCTANRISSSVTGSNHRIGFRPGLYIIQ